MPRAAWVYTSSHKSRNHDGSGDFYQRSTLAAWVFPDGLEVGRQVQYCCEDHSTSGSMRGWAASDDSQTFAVGQVVSIEQPFKQCSTEVETCLDLLAWTGSQGAKHESESDEYLVTFTWFGAAQKIDHHSHQHWSEATPPLPVLHMAPSNVQTRHEGCCWGCFRRFGGSFESNSRKAQRCDDYQLQVPGEAWKWMPQQTLVIQVVSIEERAGHVCLQMSTMGGDEFSIQLPEGSVVKVLMQSVAERLLLGPCSHVSIVKDGELLEPLSVLRSLDSSTSRESPCSQSQHESAMPETMEILDVVQSGGSSNEHVDSKVDVKLQ
mmetsp:Transcript_91293/g.230249  ORF Transcript_91293/g.230249 Transcript_91293/m.230249 type:complete len:321 (+) Transcript_91293:87-1049(+)